MSEPVRNITLPLDDETVSSLRAGDQLRLNGFMYVGRDAAHRLLVEALDQGRELPMPLQGQVIYYMGPSPARPGEVIGAAGPTTSGRMDAYAPRLIALGLKGMIGKGGRAQAVKDAIVAHKAVYMAAIGGAGALLASRIKQAEVVAYGELGPEALLRIQVEDFPVWVVNDSHGGDLYDQGRAAYARK